MKRGASYVLDSYAVLAFLENEEGAVKVEEILQAAIQGEAEIWISILNLGEVLSIIEREQSLQAAQKAIAIVDRWPVRIAAADRSRTFAAAHVKALHAVSYADAFAVALGQEVGGIVVTGDPEFRSAESLVKVEWL